MKKKLYLFDIDGTLLSPGPGARQIINRVIEKETGQNPDLQLADVAGYTDPVIIRNALRQQGLNGDIDSLMHSILNNYLDQFSVEYSISDNPFIYDDAIRLLDYVTDQSYAVGLLTGNVRKGAQIKLEKFGLFDRFLFGAFGDDAEDRMGLPAVARERARDALGEAYRYEDMVIIGDTPNDAIIATEHGMDSIIVCRYPEWKNDIIAAGATLVVESLEFVIDKY